MSNIPQLRPMTVGEILDKAFRLYRARFGTYLAISAIPLLPVAVLVGIGSSNEVFTSCFNLINSVAQYFAALALIYALGNGYLAKTIGIQEAFSAGSKRFWSYFGANFIQGLAVVASMIPLFCLIFAMNIFSELFLYVLIIIIYSPLLLFLFTRWTLVGPIVVLEEKGPSESLRRSWDLTADYFWHALGLTLASGILVLIISYIPQMIAGYILVNFVSSTIGVITSTIITQIATIIVLPFSIGVQVLLYYDLRIRKENFDLEFAVSELDAEVQVKHYAAASSSHWSDNPEEKELPPDEVR